MRLYGVGLSVCVVALLSGASSVLHGVGQAQAVWLDVQPVKQPYNLCLPASVSMVLRYWGVAISPETIGAEVPLYHDGTTGEDLLRFVERVGFRGFLVQPPFEDLLHHLEKSRPLVVVLPVNGDGGHAVVLTGFDRADQVVRLNNPATGRAHVLPFSSFRAQWSAAQRWTFLAVPH